MILQRKVLGPFKITEIGVVLKDIIWSSVVGRIKKEKVPRTLIPIITMYKRSFESLLDFHILERKPDGLSFDFCKMNKISSTDVVKRLMQITQAKFVQLMWEPCRNISVIPLILCSSM